MYLILSHGKFYQIEQYLIFEVSYSHIGKECLLLTL